MNGKCSDANASARLASIKNTDNYMKTMLLTLA